MKRTIIAVSLLLAVGLSTGCNKGKDEVLPDGTKLFGERTLKDGAKHIQRVELPDGRKEIEVITLPDRSESIGRVEYPNGQTQFDVTTSPDGHKKVGRSESSNGQKVFGVTWLSDGSESVARVQFPSGQQNFNVTTSLDGTVKIGRMELPSGQHNFDVTSPSDGTVEIGRVEFPNGAKMFHVTEFPDGTKRISRRLLPDGSRQFGVTILPNGTETVAASALSLVATSDVAAVGPLKAQLDAFCYKTKMLVASLHDLENPGFTEEQRKHIVGEQGSARMWMHIAVGDACNNEIPPSLVTQVVYDDVERGKGMLEDVQNYMRTITAEELEKHGMHVRKVPECPQGSQQRPTWTDNEGQTRYSCQLVQNPDQCLEWEGDHWSNPDEAVVPCGSIVGSATDALMSSHQ